MSLSATSVVTRRLRLEVELARSKIEKKRKRGEKKEGRKEKRGNEIQRYHTNVTRQKCMP